MLKKISFRKKVLISFLLVFALLFIAMFPLTEYFVDRMVRKTLEKKSLQIVKMLQPCNSPTCMDQALKKHEFSLLYALFQVQENEPISLSKTSDFPLTPEEIRSLFSQMGPKHKQAVSVGYSQKFSEKVVYVLYLFDSGNGSYLLGLSFPFDQIKTQVDEFRLGFYLFGTLFVMIAFLSLTWLFYQLSKPMDEIVKSLSLYTEGKFHDLPDIQLSSNASDEFDKLARTLNAMSQKISLQIHELMEERNEKESILDSLIEGVIALHENEIISYVNPAFAQMLGMPRRELFGKRLSLLSPPQKEPLTRCLLLLKIAEQNNTIVTDSIALEDSQKVFIDIIVVPKPLKTGFIIVLQDKSSQHRVLEMGKQFIANASHELRTPITIIKGFAETLHDMPDMSKDMLSEITEKIVRNCERMNTLVKSLLTLADLEHIPQSRFTPTDLVEVATRCIEHVKTIFPEAIFEIQKSAGKMRVDADADLIELALMNLLQNGVKYSNAPARLTIQLNEQDTDVVISIKDQGIGIPAEDLPHIFERFYTVNKSHSRRLGGAGLGLSIVKTIIEKHEGTISVASTPGKGTTFTITLPKKRLYLPSGE